jgi:DNA polymerase I-like protein with 3'-5' exonuclease and polymerase domains
MKESFQTAMSFFDAHYQELSPYEQQAYKKNLMANNPVYSKAWKSYSSLKGKLERCGLNYRIQATGATMTKIAIGLLDSCRNLKQGLLLAVHDELVEEYPEDMCKERSLITVEKMRQSGTYLCPNVPMDAETAVGDHWIH